MKEIEQIIRQYDQIDWSKEKAALGTVVKVDGSAYRRIGARMLVCDNGQWTGGISGGCLEGDALKRAKIAILKNESSIVVYDTREGDGYQIGAGLGCDGRIEVLFTPIEPESDNNQFTFLKNIVDQRTPVILLQVLNAGKGNEQLRGKFFTTDRIPELAAAIKVSEKEITDAAAHVFQRKKSRVTSWFNAKGQPCEILVELIRPKVKLICVGDNYDINAFVNIGNVLGWEMHIVGKPLKLHKTVHRLAHRVYALAEAKEIQADEDTALVLMSHHYDTDFRFLKQFLDTDLPYIGLLGPKKRMEKMQEQLSSEGLHAVLKNKVNLHAPAGLDTGAESPEEIALSITAEIVAVFRNRNGGFLKERSGPIHVRD